MNISLDDHLGNLRSALLKLPSTGQAGFEGLLATVLSGITGVPFRLAASGSQFGVDGKPAYEADGVCFEGKRYDDRIPRQEVLTKIADLTIGDSGDVDLWVLGATTPVGSQLADDARELGHKIGIAILIMDWTDNGLPPLGVALGMEEKAATEFLNRHLVGDSDLAMRAGTALQAIRGDDGFANQRERIHASLVDATIGMGLARRANAEWLTDVLSSRSKARHALGQPLCPGDSCAGAVMDRTKLATRIKLMLTGKPDGKIGAVLGEEGTGKSWLVARSWLLLPDKPLMVIFPAEDFEGGVAASDLENRLIDKLLEQTGCQVIDASRNRWRRRLVCWRNLEEPAKPRIVVIFDGLNQRPEVDWARLIEAMNDNLVQVGGKLLITGRTAYYTHRVARRLIAPTDVLTVPEWTDGERDQILAACSLQGAELRPAVARSLKNPRLLGIALELLDGSQIKELEELSVSRLLFEHMRIYERDAPSQRPAYEFARHLQDHGREILERITSQRRKDLKIFDGGGPEAVSDGRFFVPVHGDPTRYTIAEDGLTLALGFALLDELRSAHRDQRDLAEATEAIIGPVGALDRTAEVVLAALTVACLDNECPVEIGATVITGFGKLQNPDAEHFGAFAGLAMRRPEAFLEAAKEVCIDGLRLPNFDWIASALHAAKADEHAWPLIEAAVISWLGYYSLSPEKRMMAHRLREPVEKIEKDRATKQAEIDAKLDGLSAPEQELLAQLTRCDDGDLSGLARFALTLMAGKPIAPFVPALVRWRFTVSLNTDYTTPNKEFTHLVRMNGTDWVAARQGILEECGTFEGAEVSPTGQWALVSLLSATGDPKDAAKAQALIEKLTADRPELRNWRRLETYCATDPCDPGSEKPENVAITAARYTAVDVSKIRLTVGNTEADHFFATACPAMARFEPEVGISKHQELIQDVLGRRGLALRQGMFELLPNNALVSREAAQALLQSVDPGAPDETGKKLSERDRWIVGQYRLLLSFPLLTGEEQVEALLAEHEIDDLLLDLTGVLKPLDAGTFEDLLEKAVRDADERAQFLVLFFGRSVDTQISPRTRDLLRPLAASSSERVRTEALGIIAAIRDEALLDCVVKSGWTAQNLSTDGSFECWYGSSVIVEAAAAGLLTHEDALNRIAPGLYGQAATKIAGDASKEIAGRIDASLRSAANLSVDPPAVDIELRSDSEGGREPPLYHVSEKPPAGTSPFDVLRQISESDEAFEERQNRSQAALDTFRAALTKEQAQIILDNLGIDEFDTIAAANIPLTESWYEMFVGLPMAARPPIHNLGLMLAHALANWDAGKSVHLFGLLLDTKPLVRVTFGEQAVPLDALALWSARDAPSLNTLRFARLDRAENDDDLASEVLAALWSKQEGLLQEYIETKLQIAQPAAIARALTVAGLSRQSAFNDATLAAYKDMSGFLGRAHAAAVYAYERNSWAAHWFEQMRRAERPEDFWRFSVLFLKVVDGRHDAPAAPESGANEPFVQFWPSLQHSMDQRYVRRKERKRSFSAVAAGA